jgi:hypothetical protein
MMSSVPHEIAAHKGAVPVPFRHTKIGGISLGYTSGYTVATKRYPRYEIQTPGMKQIQKIIKCVLRYEIEVSLKNSGFSYHYGSISYLFGYEKNRCFFLMYSREHCPRVYAICRPELGWAQTISWP